MVEEKYGSFLQTLFLYVLSFLKRKYERKQFGEDPETPLKGQGGAYLPSQRHRCERRGFRFECQEVFDCAGLLRLRGRDKARAFFACVLTK